MLFHAVTSGVLLLGLSSLIVSCNADEQKQKGGRPKSLIDVLNEAIEKLVQTGQDIKLDRVTEWELGRMRIVNGSTETLPAIYEPWKYVGMEHVNGTDEIIGNGTVLKIAKQNESSGSSPEVDKRKFVFPVGSSQLWTNGIVVYKFATNHLRFKNPSSKPLIEKAMKWYEANTCIKWREYSAHTAAIVGHHSYVEIGIGPGGCSAHLGRTRGGQLNLMEPYCITMSTVLHEMGHTLGMHHEHVREDRDEHLLMKWDLIPEDRDGVNWGKTKTYNYAPYDLGSNMHYSLYSGSKDRSKMAMVPKDKELAFLASFHRPGGMSFYDMQAINHGYQCADKCSVKPNCENGGYVDFKCQCQCPSNLIGALCETIQTDHDCGGVFTVASGPVTISTPNYPTHYANGKVCTWLLKGPADSTLSLNIQDFDIPHAGFKNDILGKRVMVCVHSLEVRYNLVAQPGPKYCGENWQKGPIRTSKYAESMMMVRFSSQDSGTTGKGFRAVVTAGAGSGTAGCSPGVCQNGGTCTPDGNSITCHCTSGFSGQRCQTKNACTPSVCLNGGTCTPLGDSFYCSCSLGFSGQNCEENENAACAHGVCQNGGTCVPMGGDVVCYCVPGYYGLRCEKKKVCTPSVCKNGGTCTPMGDSFVCTCVAGFSGQHCDQNQNAACAHGVCQNGGTCVPMGGDVVCYCVPGYYGLRCEKKKVCTPSVCKNGGTCTPMGDSFVCTCAAGFSGQHCDQNQYSQSTVTSCGFDDLHSCILSQDINDDADWTIISGPTPSSRTGPSYAYRGSSYIYFETSGPGHRARLISLVLSAATRCVRFHYHMYGVEMGSLHVKKVENGVESIVWTKSHNQGNWWKQADVTITGHAPYQIVFEAVKGLSWRSDIALDELTISPTACVPKMTTTTVPTTHELSTKSPQFGFRCSFDDATLCSFRRGTAGGFDWVLTNAVSPSRNTGHSGHGYYLLAEASAARFPGDVASIVSESLLTCKPACLEFWYHIDGKTPSKLNLKLRIANLGGDFTIWSSNGQLDHQWRVVHLTIGGWSDYRIVFEAEIANWQGDIGLDDVSLTGGECNAVNSIVINSSNIPVRP